jgi:hypothetical protein
MREVQEGWRPERLPVAVGKLAKWEAIVLAVSNGVAISNTAVCISMRCDNSDEKMSPMVLLDIMRYASCGGYGWIRALMELPRGGSGRGAGGAHE